MKTINLLVLLITTAVLTLSSCSSDESLLAEEQSSLDLLKSYTVKRDATGAYYLDYDVTDNVKVDDVKDIATNSNQFYLYSSRNEFGRKVNKALSIENGQLNIDFIDTNSEKKPKITIIDDGIVLGEDVDSNDEMLAEYSITSNADATYNLNFKVKNKVEVDFVYNKEDGIYEIHLEKGKGSKSNFERTFIKNDGSNLKIDFVNHSSSSQNIMSKSKRPRRKPRVVIGNGDEIPD